MEHIERDDDELGRWRMFARPVGSVLAGHASRIRGYEQHRATPGHHVTTATARLPLVIPLGHRHRVDGPHGTVEVGAFLAGSHEVVGSVESDGFTGVQVDLSPVAAHRILGGGVADLAGHTVDLGDLFGAVGRDLVQRLGEIADWPDRLDMVESFLATRFVAGEPVDDEVAVVWERLARGHARIDDVVADLGWSRRQVRRRVRSQLGLSPKRLARLVRFERALGRLEQDDIALGPLAVELGWYDQAHMTNDFAELAGATPAEVRARRRPA
ncbi:helix-turn-helix domain-containing protein [Salsipaludibacter albus]|uniref:helix-turn-helix domain-containing protein n=1 Tax=Salsipaludibacter albus TaxID=2849650 RepID=UPI001EE49D81|nr:helix-turn-helix domain-containing protein [Salsipaludibacter albus]MBY5164304.1 helix-turn-helix domain-containing protein [Salsipaludibacter albus]